MKRIVPLFLVFLLGCSGPDPAMETALDLRSRCLASPAVRFRAEIRADYITGFEEFTLDCESSPDGAVSFRVVGPEEIADISGTVRQDEGTVEFDGAVLAYPLMAQGRLSPLGGPGARLLCLGQKGPGNHPGPSGGCGKADRPGVSERPGGEP